MKILIVHNFHRSGSASGDDQVYKNECQALEEQGIQVCKYNIINDEFDHSNIIGKIFKTFEMFWSFKTARNIKKIIRCEKPDIMHVHTFFPLISPSVFKTAKKSKIKVVQTIHDTRYICPNAASLRNGELCDLCQDGKYFRMCKYKCFKGSRFQSLIVAFIFTWHRWNKTFYKYIDKYICLNNEQIKLLENCGFDSQKIVLKYNFVNPPTKNGNSEDCDYRLPDRYVVYFGRIGEEKGIPFLCNAWKETDIPIVIMGDGPLKSQVVELTDKNPNVIYLGYVPHQQCASIVKKSEFVVMPSVWYEGCSMVIVEAMSYGKPVVTTELGFMKEAVIDGYNGFSFKLNDKNAFLERVHTLWNDKNRIWEMAEHAYMEYEEKYEKEKNIHLLIKIYKELYEDEYDSKFENVSI